MEAAENGRKMSKASLRRQREREQRYYSILNTAEALFVSEGYHSASMEQIAESAEVSVGTLYFYFKNKEDLLLKLLDEIAYFLRNLMGREYEKANSLLEAFRNAGFAFFYGLCLDAPEKALILLRESAGQGEAVELRRKEIFNKLTSDILASLERERERTGFTYNSGLSAEVMSVCIVGMLERTAYQYLISSDRSEDLETIADDVMLFIMGGIENLVNQGKAGPAERTG